VSTTHVPSFNEFVDVVREALFNADALFPSRLHDFNEILPDHVGVVPDTWWQEAYEELDAQSHLHDQSRGGMGIFPAARLSADGRLHVRDQRTE
jgi:hypothetical protein